MKTIIKCAAGGALVCGLLALSIPCASALEYHYDADLYDNHFYAPTSGNHALDLDSKDDSGGNAIVVPSDSMDTDTDQTTAGRILATDTHVLNPTAGNRITMLTCIANEPAYRFCVIGQEMR